MPDKIKELEEIIAKLTDQIKSMQNVISILEEDRMALFQENQRLRG